jgi:hypothetical protein
LNIRLAGSRLGAAEHRLRHHAQIAYFPFSQQFFKILFSKRKIDPLQFAVWKQFFQFLSGKEKMLRAHAQTAYRPEGIRGHRPSKAGLKSPLIRSPQRGGRASGGEARAGAEKTMGLERRSS